MTEIDLHTFDTECKRRAERAADMAIVIVRRHLLLALNGGTAKGARAELVNYFEYAFHDAAGGGGWRAIGDAAKCIAARVRP